MSDTAIRVNNLGKLYHIGAKQKRHDTLRDTITAAFDAPRRWFSRNGNAASEQDLWALKDVSFEVKHGEVVGIIGRNGAGKSTLLKILSRITRPTTGSVEIHGRVGSLLEVGTGFHPELTGRENIYLNGAILGMKRAEINQKFDEIVAFAEIEKFLDTPVKRYSSGMYVRLAFAVAAHLEPEILIVDEVLAVGDAQFQKKCLGKMGDVAKQGRTVLFVSHNMAAVRMLCDTAIWLSTGSITRTGDIESVTSAYMQSALSHRDKLVDLESVRRLHDYGIRLRLQRIEFNDGQPVQHGELLKVRIDFKTTRAVSDISIGVGFSSIEGIRLVSFDSDLEAARQDFPDGYQGAVTMEIPKFQLQPGRYLVDIGCRAGAGTGLDYLPGCFEIDVLPGPNTPSQIIRADGGMRLPARWKWNGAMETTGSQGDAHR